MLLEGRDMLSFQGKLLTSFQLWAHVSRRFCQSEYYLVSYTDRQAERGAAWFLFVRGLAVAGAAGYIDQG